MPINRRSFLQSTTAASALALGKAAFAQTPSKRSPNDPEARRRAALAAQFASRLQAR